MSPFFAGIFYLILGLVFTVFGIEQVKANGWTFLTFTLAFFATIDIGIGLKMMMLHFQLKKNKKQ